MDFFKQILNNLSDPIVHFHLNEIGINALDLTNKWDKNYKPTFSKFNDLYHNYPLLFTDIRNYFNAKKNNFSDISKINFISLKNCATYRTLLSSNISLHVFYKDIVCHLIKYFDIGSFLATASTCKRMFCFMMTDNILENIRVEYLQRKGLVNYFDNGIYNNICDNILNVKNLKIFKELKKCSIITGINTIRILNAAIEKGNLELVKQITKQKNIKKCEYEAAIAWAVYSGNNEIFKYILNQIHGVTRLSNALLYACYFGHCGICKTILDYKKKNYYSSDYNDAITVIEKRGNYELFKLFLSELGNYFMKLSDDNKLFHLNKSVIGGNLDIVKYWVGQRTDINKKCTFTHKYYIYDSFNSLQRAVKCSRFEILKYLIEMEGYINIRCRHHDSNLLSLACNPKNRYNPNIINIVNFLLEQNIDIEYSALRNCCINGLTNILKIFVNVSSKTNKDISNELLEILFFTIQYDCLEIFAYLTEILKPTIEYLKQLILNSVAHNCLEITKYILEIKYLTKSDKELLHENAMIYAVKYNYLDILEYLIKQDTKIINIIIPPHGELSYIDCIFCNACRQENIDIVKFFIKNGIDIRHNNDAPLRAAVSKNTCLTTDNNKIIELLFENGADVNALYNCSEWELFSGSDDYKKNLIKLLEKYGFSIKKYEDLQRVW